MISLKGRSKPMVGKEGAEVDVLKWMVCGWQLPYLHLQA